MTYYIHIQNDKIISSGEVPMGEGFISLEVTEELYNDFILTPNKYLYSNGEIVLNPNYEKEDAVERNAVVACRVNHNCEGTCIHSLLERLEMLLTKL